MKIIKIKQYKNGAHDNQTSSSDITVPIGYAIIPDNMPIPDTFPFVDIEVDMTSDPPVVTSMTSGTVPPKPELEPDPPTAEERISALESAMLAMIMFNN